jgi:tRNA threonylcarbamoyladenosine biosynthesis protein TsaB
MIVLGIETSGSRPSVALLSDEELVAERVVPLEGSRRSSALLDEADAMCREAGIAPRQIQRVAVSIGPGSFTGLRIGVTFAKTLAYAVGCPVVGVNSLHVAAEGIDAAAAANFKTLHIVSDAQRGEVFYQPFQRVGRPGEAGLQDASRSSWSPAAPREILTPASLLSRMHAGDCIAGPAVERYRSELMSAVPHIELFACEPLAADVARLGRSDFSPQNSDVWSLLPDYGRLSSAEEKRRDQPRT